MRRIEQIIIHASATKQGQDFSAVDIDRWHKERGYNGIGYHYVIRLDGTIETGRPVAQVGAHCKGWNERSVGVCYIGGLNAEGKPADTRTEAQKVAMRRLVLRLQQQYSIRKVIGHREVAAKACPCFDVRTWVRNGFMYLFSACFLLACGSGRAVTDKVAKEDVKKEQFVRTDSSGMENTTVHLDVAEELGKEEIVWTFYTDTTNRVRRHLVQVVQRKTSQRKQRLEEEKSEAVMEERSEVEERIETVEVQQDHRQMEATDGYSRIWWFVPIGLLMLFMCKIYRKN